VGAEEATYQMAGELMAEGYFTNIAVFPAVSRGRSGLRVALTTHQQPEDLEGLIQAIARRL
jgi:7-keto-8-aminopelargonate synthetase-like enzyme